MKRINRALVATARVALALLGGILFPLLVWVALAVALNQRLRKGNSRPYPLAEPAAAPADAGEDFEGRCWDILGCPTGQRDSCPAYIRRDAPGRATAGRITGECAEGLLFNLGRPPTRV